MSERIRSQYAPTTRMLWVLASGLPLALWISLGGVGAVWWGGWLAAMVLLAAADAWRLRRTPLPGLSRELETHWPVAVWRGVGLHVENRAARSLQLQLHDWYPAVCAVHGLPLAVQLAPGQAQVVEYQIRPRQRGAYVFPHCDAVLTSPWGWWRRRARLPLHTTVKVYPNYAELGLYLLLAQQHRLDQLGIHQYLQRGQGGDFHQLRDYRNGDSLRQVDWKATSRYQRLISREYREDRDQQVLFLLDSGRRMRHGGEQRGHLDEALDAMLLLAFVALRQGDAVGMLSFGGDRRWFAPRKGASVINALLNTVYDLHARPTATDYLAAAHDVLRRQRRRSLIVLLTNTRDEDYRDLLDAARLLRHHHLVVIADLRESLLDETMRQVPHDLAGALRFFATDDYLAVRHHAHQQLGHQGVHMLDVLPSQLAAALVNEYQRLKRSGQLAV